MTTKKPGRQKKAVAKATRAKPQATKAPKPTKKAPLKRRPRKDGRPLSTRGPGQPTKCTPRRTALFCEALELAMSIKSACMCAGFSEEAYRGYRVRGEAAMEALGLDPERDIPPAPDVNADGEAEPDSELDNLLARTPEDERPYVRFTVLVARAMALAEKRLVQIALQGAVNEASSKSGGGRTALAMLERRFKDDWGLTQKHEHTGKDGGGIEYYTFMLPKVEES